MKLKEIRGIIKAMPDENKELATVLIDRLEFMSDTLIELEKQIKTDGTVIDMCQGSYSIKRQHPALTGYNTTIKSYAKIAEQLKTLLPKDATIDDEFDTFGDEK